MPATMTEVLHPHIEWRRDPTFPDAPELWSPREARLIAAQLGVHLTEDTWELVRALQSYFAAHPTINIRELHDALEERFHSSGGLRYLYTLLPRGPVAAGCRLAGLNPPSGSTDTSFGSVQ